eukprot:2006599-Pleurochrysis_carterae.AAC.3
MHASFAHTSLSPTRPSPRSLGPRALHLASQALELYAEAFEEAGALDKLEAFASLNGAAFYGLPPNEEQVTLEKSSWRVPESLPFGDERVVPLYANCELKWRLQGREQCMPC